MYFGEPGKTICPTNSKAVHAAGPPSEGKRLATIDPFFDSNGVLLLPLAIILIGTEVCLLTYSVVLEKFSLSEIGNGTRQASACC